MTKAQPTQLQMFWQAHHQIAECNLLFLQFVKDGLTKEHLQRLIDHRPSLWSRYSNWLSKLPSEVKEDRHDQEE
jgi:hypothetical protein